MSEIITQPVTEQDRPWVARTAMVYWGANTIIAHGTSYEIDRLPGFIASQQGERVGLITYYIEEKACEIVSINSFHAQQGVGTLLIQAVKEKARQAGCARLWLITTNDNLDALRFYQRRDFALVAVHRDAVTEARKQKPQIPLLGDYGIPIRDEIELEMRLDQD